jgi:nitrogen fixation NifU-like protein
MAALYSDTILNHFRQPRNYGSVPDPDISCEDFNPLCGDRIRIELKVNGTIIEDVRFKGDGCAISIAAASLLTELISGSDLKYIEELSDEALLSRLASDISPSRIQCAVLALGALRTGLRNYRSRH